GAAAGVEAALSAGGVGSGGGEAGRVGRITTPGVGQTTRPRFSGVQVPSGQRRSSIEKSQRALPGEKQEGARSSGAAPAGTPRRRGSASGSWRGAYSWRRARVVPAKAPVSAAARALAAR